MIRMMKKIIVSLCVMATLTGCAAVPPTDPNNDPLVETATSSRTKNTLIVFGGILLLGAVISNEARDGATDAVRDAARP